MRPTAFLGYAALALWSVDAAMYSTRAWLHGAPRLKSDDVTKWPGRSVHTLDGLWEFAFYSPAASAPWDAPQAKFGTSMVVPASIDTLKAYASQRGVAIYRRQVSLSAAEAGSAARIHFAGCSVHCRVFVDSQEIGQHCGSYSEWWLDVGPMAPKAVAGSTTGKITRTIVVAATTTFNYTQCELVRGGEGFYLYSGITRSVSWHTLSADSPVYIDRVEVTPLSLDTVAAVLFINLTQSSGKFGHENHRTFAHHEFSVAFAFDGTPLGPRMRLEVNSSNDCVTARNLKASNITISHFEHCTAAHRLRLPVQTVPHAMPWSDTSPHLHTIRIFIFPDNSHGAACDGVAATFGLRTVRARGTSLMINGKPTRLRGFDRHEQMHPFGASLPHSALLSDAQLLQGMGANFIRGSHYPQDPRWLDVIDRTGIYLWSENFYGWPYPDALSAAETDSKRGLNPNPGLPAPSNPIAWIQASLQSLDEMISAGFNSPSIILWGYFNEGPDNVGSACAAYALVAERIRQRDPSRLVTWASRYGAAAVCDDISDVISRNVYPGWYPDVGDQRWDCLAHTPQSCWAAIGPALTDVFTNLSHFNKPMMISEIGAGAVAGFRDITLQSPWSENFQANHYAAIAAWDWTHNLTVGLAIWQFADIREEDSGGGGTWAPLIPDREKPDTRNNKGVLDAYHNPKLAYWAVRQVWRPGEVLEW